METLTVAQPIVMQVDGEFRSTLTLTRVPFPAGEYCHGPQGCGKCSDCKSNARRATAKYVETDRPYLGPRSFASLFPKPADDTPVWLVNHWPKTRQARRRAILAEAIKAGQSGPNVAPTQLIYGGLL